MANVHIVKVKTYRYCMNNFVSSGGGPLKMLHQQIEVILIFLRYVMHSEKDFGSVRQCVASRAVAGHCAIGSLLLALARTTPIEELDKTSYFVAIMPSSVNRVFASSYSAFR